MVLVFVVAGFVAYWTVFHEREDLDEAPPRIEIGGHTYLLAPIAAGAVSTVAPAAGDLGRMIVVGTLPGSRRPLLADPATVAGDSAPPVIYLEVAGRSLRRYTLQEGP